MASVLLSQNKGRENDPHLVYRCSRKVRPVSKPDSKARKLKICRTYYRKVTNTALRSLSWHRFHYKAQLSRCQRLLLLEESLCYPPIGGQLRDHTGASTEFIEIYRGKWPMDMASHYSISGSCEISVIQVFNSFLNAELC